MFFLHKLLAKFGYQTETYKIEMFKSQHPQYIVISTIMRDAMGRARDFGDRTEYRIGNITGQGLFFVEDKQKVYIETGKAEMNIQIDEYTIVHNASRHRGPRRIHECSQTYHVVFDVIAKGSYRFRFHGEQHELEIIYEQGDEHKIYTFS